MAEEIQIELKKHAYVYIEGISSNIGMDEMNNGQHAAYYFCFLFLFLFLEDSQKNFKCDLKRWKVEEKSEEVLSNNLCVRICTD